eukprot:g12603.t1
MMEDRPETEASETIVEETGADAGSSVDSVSGDEQNPEHAAQVELGLVIAGRLDPVAERAVEQFCGEILARLKSDFPGFEWSLDLIHQPHLIDSTRVEPMRLLDAARQERDFREWDFVFVVTSAELVSHYRPFALSAVSRATDAAVISTARLQPDAIENAADAETFLAMRLLKLVLHAFGHLNGLDHHSDSANLMYNIESAGNLEAMQSWDSSQLKRCRASLQEISDVRLEEQRTPRLSLTFYLRGMWINRHEIANAIREAHPWEFPARLPRLTTAAVSAAILLLMTAETWDVAHSQGVWQLAGLLVVAMGLTTWYVTMRQQLLIRRDVRLTEQSVITNVSAVAIVFSGMLTTLIVQLAFVAAIELLLFQPEVIVQWTRDSDGRFSAAEYSSVAIFISSLAIAPGLTTLIAAVLMYLVGAALVILPIELPILLTGVVAVLLHWKKPLHAFVDRMGEKDVRAIIQLVLLGLVILPVLPNKTFDQYGVLNPFEIWLMVVLICGITLGGYIAYRFLGKKRGSLLGGVLGGVISSTATTVSYSRSSERGGDVAASALVILIASTIVFVRVFVEVAVVDSEVLLAIWPPFLALMAVMALVAGGYYWFDRPEDTTRADAQESQNDAPEARTDLTAAIIFGGLYAGVLLGVSAAKEYFGDRGLYAVAAISGLTDMDAITLSTTRLVGIGQVNIDTGWRMILIGVLSNLFFKTGIVAFLGSRQLLTRIAVAFGISFVAGVLLLLLWPEIG